MASSKGAPTPIILTAQFTKRDAILYSLGIGCCNDDDDVGDIIVDTDTGIGTSDQPRNISNTRRHADANQELRFVYEHHASFEAFPTFLLALNFVAELRQPKQLNNTRLLLNRESRFGFGVRPFPPDSMSQPNSECDGISGGLIPRIFFKDEKDMREVNNLPILHISQSLQLHQRFPIYQTLRELSATNQPLPQNSIDPPLQVNLEIRIISIQPRSIGTFVTSETKYYQISMDGNKNCIATAQMTALALGANPKLIIPWKALASNIGGRNKKSKSEAVATRRKNQTAANASSFTYCIPRNAALLYRLSGDYNPIHVEDNGKDGLLSMLTANSDEGDASNVDTPGQTSLKRGPVLHGLCTMGYAVRAVLQHAGRDGSGIVDIRLTSVSCNFAKPVFVGDSLRVLVWDNEDKAKESSSATFIRSRDIRFCVYRIHAKKSNSAVDQSDVEKEAEVVVDNGVAQVLLESPGSKGKDDMSRL